jgi:hypothetical protein
MAFGRIIIIVQRILLLIIIFVKLRPFSSSWTMIYDDNNNDNIDHIDSQGGDLERNPAYRSLKAQQQIVEGAFEHMAVIHCADLGCATISLWFIVLI